MSEARTIIGGASGYLSCTGSIHLVMDLDLILEDLRYGDDGICRLENVRSCMPTVEVTCFTDLKANEVAKRLSRAGICPFGHLLTEAGRVMHHRNAAGVLEPDCDYREWLDFQSETRSHPGSAKAIGVEYLEMNWGAPRPLMVVGRLGPDTPILGLADIPVLAQTPGPKEKRSTLTCRALPRESAGLSGVVRLLLACLSAGPDAVSIKHGHSNKQADYTRPDSSTVYSKVWGVLSFPLATELRVARSPL